MTAELGGELVTFARRQLLERIELAEERIWLVSPFLTAPIGERICEAAAKSTAAQKRLLTSLGPRSVQVGVLDPKQLSKLQSCDFEIASIANLHAKVNLIDSKWGLVGSGNLTGKGLGGEKGGGNHEMGVVLNQTQIEEASRWVSAWWDEAKTVTAKELAYYEGLPKLPKSRLGDVGPTLEVPDTERLKAILAEDSVAASSRRYWINSNYHAPSRPTWWRRDWISDCRQAPYDLNDLLVIYLSARDGGPASCPAVVRVTAESEENRRWVIEHRDPEAADRWPFVTKTSVVAEVPILAGIPLKVVGKSGQSLQGGYCSITRAQFETIAEEMLRV